MLPELIIVFSPITACGPMYANGAIKDPAPISTLLPIQELIETIVVHLSAFGLKKSFFLKHYPQQQ